MKNPKEKKTFKPTGEDKRFARRIRRLRKQAGLTQEKLAEKAKLSVPYVAQIEIAKRQPTLNTLKKIASAIRVKVKDLLPY